MDRLGIGLIGCGVMGRSLGKQLLEIEAARLVGVADPNPEAAGQASEELGAPGLPDAGALLALPEVDAVVIASPGFLHRELTELAASRGKHVFVEKPMATNSADCDAMIQAAERAGVTLMVGQVLRYYPPWWQIIERVRAGEIGRPLGIDVTRIGGGYGGVWAQSWRHSREKSGGVLMEVNAHEFDFMRQVCGEVERVYAEAEHFGDDPSDFPNLLFVSLRFQSGAVGLLHSSQVSAVGESSGKVQGSEGAIAYNSAFGEGGEIRWARHGEKATVIPFRDIQIENPVRKELRLFVEAVRDGAPSPIPGSEGRANVAVAEAAYESAERGIPVKVRR